MKKFLGVFIIFSIFSGIFVVAAYEIGFLGAVVQFSLAFGFCGLIVLAVNLIMD